MRIHKLTIFIMIPLLLVALTLYIFFEINTVSIIPEIFVGIFSSALLTLSLSIIGYFVERRKTLYTLYSNIYEWLSMVALDSLNHTGQYELYAYKKSLNDIMRWYTHNVYSAFGDLNFILKKSKFTKNKQELFQLISKVYLGICDDKFFLDELVLNECNQEKLSEHRWYIESEEAIETVKIIPSQLEKLQKIMLFYAEPKRAK